MKPFAELFDRLVLTQSRNAKLKLLIDYCRAIPDPDRGYAIAAITRDLDIPSVKPAMIRTLVEERVDPVLFGYSYDFVGDLAETIALIWPERSIKRMDDMQLSTIVEKLQAASRSDSPKLIEKWFNLLNDNGRFALIKLITGGMRVGVSSRLMKQALADYGNKNVNEIEELWHGLSPPYVELFAWLDGQSEKPVNLAASPFRPVMLATPIDAEELIKYTPSDYAAEWKWDGIRVQITCQRGVKRIYSRSGDNISHSFPDLLQAMDFEGSIDGELLVGHYAGGQIKAGTFSDLQQRLNRKTVSGKKQAEFPVFVRAYDLLQENDNDLRTLTYQIRRSRLENFIAKLDPKKFDISMQLEFDKWEDVAELRSAPADPVVEGVMLKRKDAPYVPGRPRGPWFKWKKDPMLIDAVLMYAQRGHGKRSSFYSDYTFGVWAGPQDEPQIVPVGKAYFGFTDLELKQIDKYVRNNTIERFGPVRAVRAEPDHGLVMEIAFEGLNRSPRHKSGVAMRFPRISRLRWDKPAREADRLETLEAILAQHSVT